MHTERIQVEVWYDGELVPTETYVWAAVPRIGETVQFMLYDDRPRMLAEGRVTDVVWAPGTRYESYTSAKVQLHVNGVFSCK